MPDKADSSPCYKFLALVIGFFLTIVILRHPLLFDTHVVELDVLVPNITYVNRQIPQLFQRIKHLGIKTLGSTTLSWDDSQKQVHEYVRSTLITDSDDVKSDKITPLHKTMLLLGCYGGNLPEIESQLVKPNANNNPAIFYNFMLEAFDQDNSRKEIHDKVFARPTNDKSVCSCLRDFATPSLLKISSDKNAETCAKYSHDTCSMQNLIDYTIDGLFPAPDTANRDKIVVPYPTPDSRRNLKDPFLDEIDKYETDVLKKISNYETGVLSLAATNDEVKALKTFIQNYCTKVANSETVQLRCPADWFTNNNVKDTTTVKTVVTKMKTWPAYMRTYNKLRTPSLDAPSFENYIEKYEAGFEMCASFGIDNYSTEITGQTKYVHWYVLGELLLLLAALLSFMWAREVKHAAQESSTSSNEAEAGCAPLMKAFEKGIYFIICVAILLFIGLIIYFISRYGFTDYDFEFNTSDVNPDYGYFLTGFVVVWVALGVIMALFFIAIFVVTNVHGKIASFCCASDYAAVDNEKPRTKTCKKQLFMAQIVQDLPVIVGLTCMAVGTTLQRGVSNYNLILTVIVLITTTGLTTHMTNVLRIMSLRFQGRMMTDETGSTLTASMKRIQFNRVLIGAIIGLMLVVFLNLAGLDSVQGLEFASIHQTWFAIVAFVILVCGDLSLEFLAVFRRVFADEDHYLLDSVAKKSNNTGWLILISLCVLQLHSRHWLCPKYEILNDVNNPISVYCSNWF
jgi:hypothetical protein